MAYGCVNGWFESHKKHPIQNDFIQNVTPIPAIEMGHRRDTLSSASALQIETHFW